MVFSEIAGEKRKKERGNKLGGRKVRKPERLPPPLGVRHKARAVFFYFFLRAYI
nr:MAG TPA: hypothetical protein [Caudoviricetes sp.]